MGYLLSLSPDSSLSDSYSAPLFRFLEVTFWELPPAWVSVKLNGGAVASPPGNMVNESILPIHDLNTSSRTAKKSVLASKGRNPKADLDKSINSCEFNCRFQYIARIAVSS